MTHETNEGLRDDNVLGLEEPPNTEPNVNFNSSADVEPPVQQAPVRVGRMPGTMREYTGKPCSIFQLLRHHDIDPEGFEVRVDSQKITDMNYIVQPGQTVILVKPITGNRDDELDAAIRTFNAAVGTEMEAYSFAVPTIGEGTETIVPEPILVLDEPSEALVPSPPIRVGRMPGTMQEYSGKPCSVRELLERSGINPTGFEIRVNSEKVTDMNFQVPAGATVILVKPITGNFLGDR
jgi:sulfur carrier protein ThiS